MAKASPKPLSLDRTKRQLKRLFANPEMTSLAWNYEVGKLVEVIHPAKAGSSYGNSTIQDLANDIQEGGPKSWPSVLTQARKFASQRPYSCACMRLWILAARVLHSRGNDQSTTPAVRLPLHCSQMPSGGERLSSPGGMIMHDHPSLVCMLHDQRKKSV